MSAQPTKAWHRIFGPWPTVNLKGQLVACAAASSEGLRLGMTAPAPPPPIPEPLYVPPELMPGDLADLLRVLAPDEGVESTPNKGGDAVRQETKDKVVRLFPGVQVGMKVMARQVGGIPSLDQPLDLQDAPGRDATTFDPVVDGLRNDAHRLGERHLGAENVDDATQRLHARGVGRAGTFQATSMDGSGSHSGASVSYDLMPVHSQLIVSAKGSQDPVPMAAIPPPDNFTSFPGWLTAAMKAAGLSQRKLAKICEVSPQSFGAYFKGAKPKPVPLQKVAQWSGHDYAKLRLLLDEQPLPGNRKARAETLLRRDPNVERIASMLDMIAGDEEGLRMASRVVQEIVTMRKELRPKQRVKNE